MSDEMLDTYIRQLFEAQPLGEVNVAWQGGEPTLMGLDFFEALCRVCREASEERADHPAHDADQRDASE